MNLRLIIARTLNKINDTMTRRVPQVVARSDSTPIMAVMRLIVAFAALTAGRLGYAARAYPDGVSMKHPSYYTYGE